ncbi:MAG: beta-lactamase-like protein [Verrucomicrobiaceae bacterium]|nr:beta-lactamase-like protein [Verrucomicrobiaceae bacterium]
MIFEQITTGGCQSYLIGCPDTCVAALIDPESSQIDRYLALAARDGLRIHYAIDTHTHADHFSALRLLAEKLGLKTVMHRQSSYRGVDMRVDHGELIVVGKLRLNVLYTPGHTNDSMCLIAEDRVFTGDTLLIGGTGRTDLPTGDPNALYDSLFQRLLLLDPALLVYPAHDYKGRGHSTIGAEIVENPRLQRRERDDFVAMMHALDLSMPTHLTEALRTNMSGGKTIAEMLAEAAASVSFMSLAELRRQIDEQPGDLVILDVREREAYLSGHVRGALLLPRGQLELRVNEELPNPTQRVLTICEYGRISTLAAATLHEMGFQRAIALDGGMKGWRDAGYPLDTGADPQAD